MPGNQRPRQRKHRGTQTGSVTRAQRARPRNRQEAIAQARSQRGGKGKRQPADRRDVPPSWRGAFTRGVLFAALLFPVSLIFGQKAGGALVLTLIAVVLYVPLGFYTEQFFYRRRRAKQRRENAARQGGRKR